VCAKYRVCFGNKIMEARATTEEISLDRIYNQQQNSRTSSSTSSSLEEGSGPVTGEAAESPSAASTTLKKKKKKSRLKLAPPSYSSHFLMLWIGRLVAKCFRMHDVRNIIFLLEATETAQQTGDLLCSSWQQELDRLRARLISRCKSSSQLRMDNNTTGPYTPSLFRALYMAFGWKYAPLGIWKLVWVGFTWIGNYYSFSFLLAYSQAKADGKDEPVWHGHLY
jgi:hypothetical protein